METTRSAARPQARGAFGTVRKLVAVYGVLGVAVLAVVVWLAAAGHEVTSFMWGRSAGMVASAAVVYWLVAVAARGARWAYVRLRVVAVVVPVAVIALDGIPGALPAWFVVVQVVGALALLPAAVLLNRAEVRAGFARTR